MKDEAHRGVCTRAAATAAASSYASSRHCEGLDKDHPLHGIEESVMIAAKEHVKPSLQSAKIPARRALAATTISIRQVGFVLL